MFNNELRNIYSSPGFNPLYPSFATKAGKESSGFECF